MATDSANMADGVADDEMPELTLEKLRTARSFAELLEAKGIRRPGRPPSDDPKVRITIRLNAAVVEHFKDKGAGWQTRLNEALADLVEAEKRPRPRLQSRGLASYAKKPGAKAAAKKTAPKAAAKAAAHPAAAKKAPAEKAAARKPGGSPTQRKRGRLIS